MAIRQDLTFCSIIHRIVRKTTNISERKNEEGDEKQYRLLFESNPLPMWVFDCETLRFLAVNDAAVRHYGYSREEFLSMTLKDIRPPDEVPELLEYLQQATSGRQRTRMWRHRKKDGTIILVEITNHDFVFNGRKSRMILANDITERQRADEVGAENRRRMEALFQNALDAILLADDEGRYVDANPAACDLFGFECDELLRMKAFDTTPLGNAGSGPELWRQFIATGSWSGECRIQRKDGESREAECRAVANIVPGLHLSIIRDVTERNLAERQIRERARQQAAVAKLGQQALAGIDSTALLQEIVQTVVKTLDVEYCKILQLSNNGTFLLRAGAGWKEGQVGQAAVNAGTGSQAGYTLLSGGPVIVEDLRLETRFRAPSLLIDHGVVSGVSCVIHGEGRPFGVLGADTTVLRRFTSDDVNFLQSVANLLAMAITHAAADEKLHQISARLLQLQDEERRRIARELHDGIAQSLAGLNLNLAVVNESASILKGRSRRALAESLVLAEHILQEVRTSSYLMHPPILDELGLGSAVAWYVEGFSERSGIRVDLDVGPNLGRVPRDVETTVFRIVQECLTNIRRHSRSSTAVIRICRSRTEIVMEAQDNGTGMRLADSGTPATIAATLGVGIAGMQERAHQLGGRLEIQSGSGGTTVKAVLPIPEKKDA